MSKILLIMSMIFFFSLESFALSLNQLQYNRVTTKLKKNDFFIKIKRIPSNKIKLKKWFEDQYFLLSNEVKSFRSPYRGAVTKNISCQDELAPERKEFSSKEMLGAIIYKTDKRYIQNTCINKEVYNISALLVFNCADYGYKIKIHMPKENEKESLIEFIKKINCGNG